MYPTQLTPTERALYETRLTEARTKRHEIATGRAIKRFVDQNGETVEYSAANLGDLDTYIRSLEELLNPCLARYNRPRPLGFLF